MADGSPQLGTVHSCDLQSWPACGSGLRRWLNAAVARGGGSCAWGSRCLEVDCSGGQRKAVACAW